MKPVAFLYFVIVVTINAKAQWTPTAGPTGAISYEIFYLQNHLFVNGYNGGVYRSADKGITWSPVNNGLPTDLRCYAMHVENNRLYVVTSNGTYFSDDLGDSWHVFGSPEFAGFSMAVSANEIFIGLANRAALQYSPDSGNTWQLKSFSTVEESAKHLLKWKNTLWLGTDSKIYTSSDNGASWNLFPLDITPSSLTTADGDLFISGNDGHGFFGVYRSTDGTSWTQILSTQETNIPGSGFLKLGNTLYVSAFTSLYYSDDDGATWTTKVLPQSFNFFRQTFIANIDDELFISCGDGILYTSDRGTTWERRNIDYKNHSIIQLARTNQSVVCYSEFNGIYVSKDEGNSWKWIPDHDQYRPRQVYAHGNTIVASYLLGVYKSEDEGDTWQKIFTLIDDIPGTHAIPDVYLTGWQDALVYCTYKGVYFSTDMGLSWNLWPISMFDTDSWIFKSFVHGDTVALLTEKEIFITLDFGKTWQKRSLPEGLLASYYSITGMHINESSITMSTLFGLYTSSDLGVSWKRNECIPDRLILDMAQVGEILILATYSGVYASENGVDWYGVRDGLPGARTMAIVVKDRYAYVGTWGKSVWKRPLTDLLTPHEPFVVDGDEVPTPVVEYDCSTITVVNAAPQVQVKWYKDGALIPNENGTKLITSGEGTYQVSLESDCELKLSENITIGNIEKPDFTIYNIITANGDGKNDCYFLHPDLAGSRLYVYNRWGKIIYSNESYDNSWSPSDISPGQYFYAIESKCYGEFKGVLTILKP